VNLPATHLVLNQPDLRPLSIDAVAAWTLEVLHPQAARLYQAIGARGSLALPDIVDNLRGLAAGQVRMDRHTAQGEIRLNPQLWTLNDGGEALFDTIAHEMAHWVIMQARVRERSHGPAWQRVARALGCDGKRCHQLPLRRARRCREYCYRISEGRDIWLGPGIHRAVQTQRRRYRLAASGQQSIHIPRDGFTGQSRWRGETDTQSD